MSEGFASFAQRQFELSAPQEDGSILRDHLDAISERTGRVHPLIADAPPLPEGCDNLWLTFLSLHSRRGSNGFGPSRLTYGEIKDYQTVTNDILEPWEVDAIMKADDAYFASMPKPKAKP